MRRPKINGPGAATLLVLVVAWEALVRYHVLDFEYLPAPSEIVAAWIPLIASGEMFQQTLHTFIAVMIGWSVAAALGVGLGIALGLSPFLRRWSLASFEVLRPLPAIAFLPLALLLFNFSLRTELVLIIYASIWPAFVNTMGGVMQVSPQLREMSRSLRLSPMRTLTQIVLPAAAPAIVTGCRLSMGLTLVMAIIAEMLANPQGLGYAVISELQAMQPARMFAYILYIGLIAIGLNSLLTLTSDFLLRHHPHVRGLNV